VLAAMTVSSFAGLSGLYFVFFSAYFVFAGLFLDFMSCFCHCKGGQLVRL